MRKKTLLALALAVSAASVHAAPSITTVSAAENMNRITIGGTVAPYAEVTLTAQAPGRVQFIAGEAGDRKPLGAVLVALNSDDLQARYKEAQAGLNNAEATLRNAQVQYSRELWSPAGSSISRMPGMMMPSMFDQMFTRQAATMMSVMPTCTTRARRSLVPRVD
jgi:multidrug resistance efflux pump